MTSDMLSFAQLWDEFQRPLRSDECAHVGCDAPRDPGSALCFCAGHDVNVVVPARSRGRSQRCSQCQQGLGVGNRSGLCLTCSVRRSRRSFHDHSDGQVAA